MLTRTLLVLALAAAALGCQQAETSADRSAVESPEAANAPIYRNAKGEIECPVMHKVIASEAAAKGSQVFEGKKYLFCCGMCPGKFRENPRLYAKG